MTAVDSGRGRCAACSREHCSHPDALYQGVVPVYQGIRPTMQGIVPTCPHAGCDYPAGTACTNAMCPGRWPRPRRNRSSHPIPPTDDRMTSGGSGHRAAPASIVSGRR